ncbi:sulfate permease, partial [archaeon]
MNDLLSTVRQIPFTWLQVPIIDWLPEYTKEKFYKDLTAGVTVFVFMVPQGIAYAMLAGMPPAYGLYSSIVPLYLYAILGTSRQLSIGPMAITSLLLGVSCQKFGFDDESPEYIQIAMNISMLVGLITFFLGMFRMGTLVNLLSHSVLVGFLTASSLIIAINQLKYIFGIDMPRFAYVHQTLYYLLTHLQDTNVYAFLLGFFSWLVLVLIRVWKNRYKPTAESTLYGKCSLVLYALANMSSFLVILLGSFIARVIIQAGGNVHIVGTIPLGLLTPGFAFIPFPSLLHIFPTSLAISFVAFAGNWAVTRKYSIQYNYEVDATQELLGEGFTIIVGVLFNAFVVSGGLARSAVNAEAGAVTQISGVITASFILLAVLTLTSSLYYIPMSSLAAVIEVSIISMLDFTSMRNAYHVDKRDCMVMVATFLFTFFIGVSEGLFAGMFLSIAVVMRSAAFPSVVHLGRLSSGLYYKNVLRFPEAEQIPGVAIIRMDASLFFGNCTHFKQAVKSAAYGVHHSKSVSIHTVIVDASAWIDIDLAGIQTLLELKDELMKQLNVQLRI